MLFKLVLFTAYFLLVFPIGVLIARLKPVVRDVLFYAMIFLTCEVIVIHLAPWPEWRGSARGFAFSLNDFVMFIVLASMFFDRRIKFRFFPPGSRFYLLYFAISLLSICGAALVLPFWFEVWKMVIMYLFMITVYNYLCHKRELWPLLYTLIAVLGYMMLVALWQKYVRHAHHVAITFPHRNSMAMYCTLLGTLLWGVLLNETLTLRRWLFVAGGFAMASVMILFSFSRGGMVFYGFGLLLTVALTVWFNGLTAARARLLALMIVVMTIPVTIAMPRIIERFLYAPESSGETRIHLALAAVRMANANFWGVGLNNFSDKSGPSYSYNREHYETFKNPDTLAGVQGGVVETIYLLVAAECGWLGLAALLLWLFYYYGCNFLNLLAYRGHECFGIAVGFCGGLTANYIQSTLEWALKQSNNFYELMMVFAVIAAMRTFRPQRRRIG